MYFKSKRVVAILLVIAMMISLMPTFGIFADSTSNHWASETLQKWQQQGMLKGDAQGNIQPDKALNRAEFIALVNRMKGYSETSDKVKLYTDVRPNDWYYDDVAIALEAGYINGTSDNTMSPLATITRQEAMAIMARVESLTPNESLLEAVKDGAAIANWAQEATSACINAGFITGYQGNITPQANITKAQAIVLLDRILTNARAFSFAGTYGGTISDKAQYNDAKIMADGVKLQYANVKNDLVIDKAVADGDVHLDYVNVAGNLYANGGGVNSLYFNNVSVGASLVVEKYDDNIRIYFSGNSKVNTAVLKSGAMLVTQELKAGAIESVEIPQDLAQSAKVNLIGNFNNVVNNSNNLNLNLKGVIKHLALKKNALLTGKGNIAKLSQENAATLSVNSDSYKQGRSDYGGIKLPDTVAKQVGGTSSGGSSSVPTMASLKSLTIKEQPHKLIYRMAEQLDLTGLVVEGHYSNNTTKVLKLEDVKVTGYNANKLGEQTLTVHADGKTATFVVDVYKTLPVGSEIIKVTTAAAITFENGINVEKMALPKVLNVVYRLAGATDDSVVDVIWQAISGYDQNQKSEQHLTVDGAIVVPNGVNVSVTTATAINITVRAKNWQVAFETPQGAAKLASQTVKHQAKATQPEAPAIEGYTFVGYKLENKAEAADFDFNTPITKDTKVYAVYKINVYDVVFTIDPVVAGVAAPQALKVRHGELATKPAVIKNGDNYSEWYSDQALTKPFDFTQPIKQNTTIYVKWVKDPILMEAARALTFNTIKGDNQFDWSVVKNLNLISSLPNGISVSWSSDDAAVVSNSGVVSRPVSDDKAVTLTATLSRNGISTTKQITVMVVQKGLDIMRSDYIDPRFAAGYPKLSLDDNKEVVLKIKLKPGIASADNPVEAFVNWRSPSQLNTVDPYKVHLGFESDSSDYMNSVYYQKITDDAEYLIETNQDLSKLLREYAFVLKQNNSFNAPSHSTVPTQATVLNYSMEVYQELHKAIDVGVCVINNDKDKIILYVDEQLNTSMLPSASDFKLTDASGDKVGAIENIAIVNDEKKDRAMIVLNLRDAEEVVWLYYTGSVLKSAQTPALSVAPFKEFVLELSNCVGDVALNHDHTYLSFSVFGFGWRQGIVATEDLLIKSDDQEVMVKRYFGIESLDAVTYYRIKLANPINPENFTIEMKQPQFNAALDTLKFDKFVASPDNVIIHDALTFDGKGHVAYDDIEMLATTGLPTHLSPYYCSVNIDGDNYNLLGDIEINGVNSTLYKPDGDVIKTKLLRVFTSNHYLPDEYSYFQQVILPKIKQALANDKPVKFIYDSKPTEFTDSDWKLKGFGDEAYQKDLVNGKYEWTLVKD